MILLLTIHPQFIKDTAGKKMVVLTGDEFDEILGKIVVNVAVKETQNKISNIKVTNSDIQKSLAIKNAVTNFFENSIQTKVMAKDLMTLFVSKNIFKKDIKEGLPIRAFLRKLDKSNHLHLIPQVHFQQNNKNKNWYFIKINN